MAMLYKYGLMQGGVDDSLWSIADKYPSSEIQSKISKKREKFVNLIKFI